MLTAEFELLSATPLTKILTAIRISASQSNIHKKSSRSKGFLATGVFVWAYRRSCARYAAVSQSLGDPDPFRLLYREQIRELVTHVVRQRLNKKGATAKIRQQAAAAIEPADQPRFIEVVETELMSLHVGSIARYRLRPSEYETWRSTWV